MPSIFDLFKDPKAPAPTTPERSLTLFENIHMFAEIIGTLISTEGPQSVVKDASQKTKKVLEIWKKWEKLAKSPK